jgi:hypothetical protein
MGYESYYDVGNNVSQANTESTALAMSTNGMQAVGYQYVQVSQGFPNTYRHQDGSLWPNVANFPNGMQPVGAYIHNLGLKFGIYEASGSLGCSGSFPGGYGHEQQDAQTFASWGADYVQWDICGSPPPYDEDDTYWNSLDLVNGLAVIGPSRQGVWELEASYLRMTGRPIDYNICVGFSTTATWAPQAGANSFRFAADIGTGSITGLRNTFSALPMAQAPTAYVSGITATGTGNCTYQSSGSTAAVISFPITAGVVGTPTLVQPGQNFTSEPTSWTYLSSYAGALCTGTATTSGGNLGPSYQFAGPGLAWFDPDNLQIGNFTSGSSVSLAVNDQLGITQKSMWDLVPAPLTMGGSITGATANSLATLTNLDDINIDQDQAGLPGWLVSNAACGSYTCYVWARQLSGINGETGNTYLSGCSVAPYCWAIGYFNLDSAGGHDLAVTWSAMNAQNALFPSTPTFTNTSNVWSVWPSCVSHHCGAGLGTLAGTGYDAGSVPAYSSVLITLAP